MMLPRHIIRVLAIAAALAIPAHGQNWWSPNEGSAETGKLQELKEKRKVFLNVVFNTTETEINAQQEQTQIRRVVTRAISAYKGIELVGTAEQADFAISVTASQTNNPTAVGNPVGNFSQNLEPGIHVPLEVTVLTRGAMTRSGAFRPRVVWSMASQNVQGEPGPAAVFAVDGFIDLLKQVRGEKK